MSWIKRSLDKIMLLDLFAGLGITFKHLWKKKVTVQYPEERMEPAHRFRGMFRLDEERCIKCTLCARDCPIDIRRGLSHQSEIDLVV
jgi:NADH-quinone oxidoreductase subunit I